MVPRDRTVDLIRVLAMGGVVLGHWLVTVPLATPSGWRIVSPLQYLDELVAGTWLLQTLPVFFFAAGFAAVRSSRSSGHRAWLGNRVRQLAHAVLPLGVFWLVTVVALMLLGVPDRTVVVAAALAVGPLWFLGIYLLLLAGLPLIERFTHAYGWSSIALPIGIVAACDLVRYGPWHVPEVVESLTWLSVPFGWLVPFQLGYALATDRLTARAARVLVAGGLIGAGVLMIVADYPVSMVGVTGAERSNLGPVSLLVIALGLLQVGGYGLLRTRLTRLLDRPRLARFVDRANTLAMPIYLWHQSALVLVALVLGAMVGADGLVGAPDHVGWLGQRLAWLPVVALVLAILLVLVRPGLDRAPAPTVSGRR